MLAAWVTALVTFKGNIILFNFINNYHKLNFLSDPDEETRHLFARANVIEGLVQLLENTDNPNVVQKACWAITNLSSDGKRIETLKILV
jgi:hypothetical protein